MKGFVSVEQLKSNIINYSDELINIQRLSYEDYASRINLHIAAVNTKNADTEVNKSLKAAFLEVLNHVLPEEFYNKTKEDEHGDITSRDCA